MSSWLPGVAGFAGSLFSSSANQASAQASIDFQREVLQNRNQWMVEDLRKAGLNPILALGTTQSTAQGATYQTENPASSAVQSYVASKQASIASRQQDNQDAIAKAQVSVLNSQASANTAKALKDAQDVSESKARIGMIPSQIESFGASAAFNRSNAMYLEKMTSQLDYQAQQILSNLETARKERDLLIQQAQTARTQSERNLAEASLARANSKVASVVEAGKRIYNQGIALDVRSKELNIPAQETDSYYNSNVIGKSFKLLGNMLRDVNPFKFK